ncbi:MAG: hypothetical protein QFX33_02170 [Candidatus Nezhaarchaeota archaeon]|nr:hypothetical protein [Candidatus Nezhaarchaeota archaeon]
MLVSETGENIFKVSRLSASSPKGEWTAAPGSGGADGYPDYWVLSGNPLKPGESLRIRFVLDSVEELRYEDYPWTILSDVEVSAPVIVEEHYLLSIAVFLRENASVIASALGALAAAFTVAAVAALSSRAPFSTRLVEEVFQQEPLGEGRGVHRVELRVFKVPRCGRVQGKG